jgi:hypothetical protein
MHSHTKNQVNISNQSEKKVVTTKYLANFQSPRAHNSAKNHWTGTKQNVILICNLSLYTHIPNIKSISQSIAKKSGDNCFISEIRTWVTIKIIVRFDLKSNGSVSSTFMYNIYQYLIYIITLSRQS